MSETVNCGSKDCEDEAISHCDYCAKFLCSKCSDEHFNSGHRVAAIHIFLSDEDQQCLSHGMKYMNKMYVNASISLFKELAEQTEMLRKQIKQINEKFLSRQRSMKHSTSALLMSLTKINQSKVIPRDTKDPLEFELFRIKSDNLKFSDELIESFIKSNSEFLSDINLKEPKSIYIIQNSEKSKFQNVFRTKNQKPSLPLLFETSCDWKCNICENIASSNICTTCYSSPTDKMSWKCPECLSHNTSHHYKCWKCKFTCLKDDEQINLNNKLKAQDIGKSDCYLSLEEDSNKEAWTDGWVCSKCKQKNISGFKTCFYCNSTFTTGINSQGLLCTERNTSGYCCCLCWYTSQICQICRDGSRLCSDSSINSLQQCKQSRNLNTKDPKTSNHSFCPNATCCQRKDEAEKTSQKDNQNEKRKQQECLIM